MELGLKATGKAEARKACFVLAIACLPLHPYPDRFMSRPP